MDTPNFDIAAIALKFQITGGISEVRKYGTGHINDTFLLKNSNAADPDYLLQRINHQVFKDVLGLMENIARVTAHLQSKLTPGTNQKLLQLIDTKDGGCFYRDGDNNYWRLYFFIPGSRSYDVAETTRQAYEAGMAFGRFQSTLSDMDPALLSETIVDFHNIQKRLKDFHEAVQVNKASRVSAVSAEIDIITRHEQAMSIINEWGQAGLLPKRITHNDTKLNNVLFDADDNAICVIDLDTVMTGYVAYDFGDAIRTITNTAAEDEPDLEKIQVNTDLFKAYTEGYLKTAGSFLTEKEVESLSWGMLLLPYMQGVRFLTDYLQGDTYFKIEYPDHNLIRAKAQFSLFTKLYEQSPQLRQIITETVAAYKDILQE
ncbi:phosphotransferase enzyme family protein [Mucilaginibacter sp. UR6-11]|uniref:phosphotransferase enzyme family protein n=1 Tax=Mucilaginibacter sp. UR6-11 TaxID=1435644 RepID=UPI001E30E2E3|nr:aminoglycoside phosphotransferase family protein [Mucilaginibacter sp. UR6-11]MCC8423681.1 aminoglycoside phosphotransferase family protein [Mucilaginibacter sp. UR6-11]